MAETKLAFQLGSGLATGHLTDAKYTQGTYTSVATIEERDALVKKTDASDGTIVKGSLVYVQADDKIYKYNGTEYVEFEAGGGDAIIEITKAEYDALTPEEKKDKTYLITDATVEGNITGMISSDADNAIVSGTDGGLYVAKPDEVSISADANNILKKGTDDGLYVPKTTVTSTYSSTGTEAVNGTAVASAISGKANSSALGTQVTYTLSGTTLYINTK